MNNINQNHLDKLRKLYQNGQLHIPSRALLEAMSTEELENFIQEAERTPKRTYLPLDRELRNSLTGMMKEGDLDVPMEDLDFMSQARARRYFWMCHKAECRGVRACTPKQYKRIKAMMKMNIIDYMPDRKIKMIPYSEAQQLLRNSSERR